LKEGSRKEAKDERYIINFILEDFFEGNQNEGKNACNDKKTP
jgi:hypothetical protein